MEYESKIEILNDINIRLASDIEDLESITRKNQKDLETLPKYKRLLSLTEKAQNLKSQAWRLSEELERAWRDVPARTSRFG